MGTTARLRQGGGRIPSREMEIFRLKSDWNLQDSFQGNGNFQTGNLKGAIGWFAEGCLGKRGISENML